MGRERTAADVIGLGAGLTQLAVMTLVKVPIAAELGATGTSPKALIDIRPFGVTVLLHVGGSDLVRDALVAERCDQPIENLRGVVLSYCCSDTLSVKVGAYLVDQVRGPGQTANAVNHRSRMIEGGCPIANFWMVLVVGRASPDCRRDGHAQINATSLRCASLSPSMYRWVVWIDR